VIDRREEPFDLSSSKVDGENFDEFMKELGVGMMMRMAAKSVKPRLVIGENAGKWHIRSESTFRTVSYDFIPGVPFDETTPDGREVTVSASHPSLQLI
jgi:fatty acid-binding protein 3, muscle and heart